MIDSMRCVNVGLASGTHITARHDVYLNFRLDREAPAT